MNIQAFPAGRSVFRTALIDDIRDSLSLEHSGKSKARRAGANDSNLWTQDGVLGRVQGLVSSHKVLEYVSDASQVQRPFHGILEFHKQRDTQKMSKLHNIVRIVDSPFHYYM
ncbi:hypothetical protein PENSUB_5872 [Penicillium subrubescens]|uniref:Uncharacterized protein n=1 Tax=Penicillium subrubescens TaxID=1316194 RepID=A0A1Q5UQQ3_9EURO|nr:hypothetical protein PENSUB_5872 [Penicillium subrubescens]